LVLQALRPIFPQALFFTTDLDARYLHPDEHEWTRNLIVAAHFGLEPGHSLQQPRSYPPFRDSYQTATFISTRLALQGSIPLNVDEPCPDFANSAVNQAVPEHSLEQLRDVLGSLWEPRIFEVGRTQAIDLSPRRGSEADPSLPKRLCLGSTRVSGFYPDPSAGLEDRGKQFGLGLAALGVITFLSFLLVNKVRCAIMEAMKRLRHGASCHPWRLLIAVLITASVLVAALASIQRDLTTGEIEPFLWAEGVSIWPSEFIRMLAFVTSIYFLFKASRSIKESQRQISKRYFDGEHLIADNDGHIGKELESQLFRYWNIVCKPWRNNANPTSNFAAWRHYVEAGQVHWRIYRVIVLTALQLLFGFLLMNLFEPPIRPFRGDASKFIDVILLIASIVSFAVLIFFVVDATRLCIHWVRQTTVAQAWPEVTTRYYQNSFNLKPEFLDEWIDVQLMAEHTLAIQRLIYFPFIILFLVIVSRSTLIDNWRTPVGLFIILSINLAYAVSCAYFLRNAVEDARQKAINKLTGKLINAKGCHDENSKCVVSQLETLIESIKSMRAGVFSPFTQQPLVRAILVPLSGYGGIALIEYGLRYFH
jgi:hypothetical protein